MRWDPRIHIRVGLLALAVSCIGGKAKGKLLRNGVGEQLVIAYLLLGLDKPHLLDVELFLSLEVASADE